MIDVACGTGHHAAMFHSWGLRVEGADLSAAMIDRARAKFGLPQGLQWTVRGFDQPIEPAETVRRRRMRRQFAGAGPRPGDCRACDSPDARRRPSRRRDRRSSPESLASPRRPLRLAEMPTSQGTVQFRLSENGTVPLGTNPQPTP